VLVTLVAIAGFGAPRPASGCSCAQVDPATALADYPAAFTGTLVDVDRGISGLFGDGDAIYRFEVETWVKGDLGPFVDVRAPSNGAACGIEVGIGHRAGVFLYEVDGGFASSLCDTVDADVLLAASRPLAIGAEGPPVLLIVGQMVGYNYLTVNSSGEVVSAFRGQREREYDQPWRIAACPGGDLILEQWTWQLVVRDLSDLTIVDRISLADFANEHSISDARCMDADGSSVWLAGDNWNNDRSEYAIYDASNGLVPILNLPAGQAWIGANHTVIQDLEGNTITSVDHGTGESKVIHESTPRGPDSNYTGVGSVAFSPDGTSIAVLEVDYPSAGKPTSVVTIYDESGAATATVDVDGEAWRLDWTGGLIIVQTPQSGHADFVALVLSAGDLSSVIELVGWDASNPVLAGNFIYGTSGGALVRADLSSGSIEELNTLPTPYLGPLAALPDDFDSSSTPTEPDQAPQPATPTVPPITIPAGSESNQAMGAARIILIALSLVAGALVLNTTLGRARSAVSDS